MSNPNDDPTVEGETAASPALSTAAFNAHALMHEAQQLKLPPPNDLAGWRDHIKMRALVMIAYALLKR